MSLTEKWIKEQLEFQGFDKHLSEITEDEYNETMGAGIKTKFIKDLFDDIKSLFNNPPFPLLKVKVIEEYETSVNQNGSMSWGLQFMFKYKGKYYDYSDYGST